MRPDQHDLDEEIRGHLALSIKERVDSGEDPEAARLAALREFGYVPAVREAMRRVWYTRLFDAIGAFGQDVRVAFRSLARARGLAATVVVTLALGIGANAAIFSVVREVLLRPLVNRDEDRLIYIRQSAPGLGAANVTFSVPEIDDLKSAATTISTFGDFSTIDFTMVGFGEPRSVKAGVVGGSFFEVMGLRPALGRLIAPSDDGPEAPGVAVLTYRFWTTALNRDPSVVGTTIRLGSRTATVVGVLEPSVPYPVETEIIANMVTSPHHLSATMVTQRTHRMTELFGRLAPDATVEQARAELAAIHAAAVRAHPESYSTTADMQLGVARLRQQIAAPARPVLLLLLAAAGLVFVIACANVANLILARSVRREGELAVRAALGASAGALRRTLLAESVLLCGAGALLGVLLARPMVGIVGKYAARFSLRALDVPVDATLLWVSVGLAMAAAVALAFVPRLPSPHAPVEGGGSSGWFRLPRRPRRRQSGTAGLLASGTIRITPVINRRLRIFAVTQIALSFVLLAGAGMLLSALVTLQRADTGYDLQHVLAIDVPMPIESFGAKSIAFVDEATRRISEIGGVEQVAAGNVVPWRDAGLFGPGFQFTVEGYTPKDGEEAPYARLRNVSPGFFAALGIPMLSGRDFTNGDRGTSERVVIVSQSLADRLFPAGDALNRRLWWTDPYFGKPEPRRIVGIVATVDDERIAPGTPLTIYHPFRQMPFAGRLFVHTRSDPRQLAAPIARIIREMSADQPVERAATLEDVRAELLGPERLNAFVVSGFAGVALLIAVVGVAGVLAFSVSARIREFGVRLAVGSSPWRLLAGVLAEGVSIVTMGIAAGAGAGYVLGRVAAGTLDGMQLPGAATLLTAAAILAAAAIAAATMPAARASRVDVLQALRSE